MPIEFTPGYLFMMVLLGIFLVGSYWYVRKILRGFREGIDRGRR